MAMVLDYLVCRRQIANLARQALLNEQEILFHPGKRRLNVNEPHDVQFSRGCKQHYSSV